MARDAAVDLTSTKPLTLSGSKRSGYVESSPAGAEVLCRRAPNSTGDPEALRLGISSISGISFSFIQRGQGLHLSSSKHVRRLRRSPKPLHWRRLQWRYRGRAAWAP